MDRVAVFVDAGYLFAQGSVLASGAKRGARPLPRSRTRLDEPAMLAFFERIAQTCANLPLLRIYWYDGTNAGPTPSQISLASRPNVKLRLGIVNSSGEQKGVDSLIVTDLISLSRNRAMADAVLVTGDEDIRVGVQQAQELGVRVHLVGLEPATNKQSFLLRQEADTLREVTKAEVDTFLSLVPLALVPVPVVVASSGSTVTASGSVPSPAPIPSPSTSVGTSTLTTTVTTSVLLYALDEALVARTFAASLLKSDVERVVNASGSIPSDLDRMLLAAGRATCGRSLTVPEKHGLRRELISFCKTLPS